MSDPIAETSRPLVALAAGGTGGHMFPAAALAEELQRRGRRVLLITDVRGQRYTDGFQADETVLITAGSPSVGGAAAKVFSALAITGGLIRSMSTFKRLGVAAVVGFGGYPSLPAVGGASLMKIPYGVHEQNGVLGRTNRLLVGKATFTAHAFPALDRLPKTNGLVLEVGNPVRDAVAAVASEAYAAPGAGASDKMKLLVFGGSQGASVFAEAVPRAVAALPETARRRLSIVQQARDADMDAVKDAYAAAGVDAEIAPFFQGLPQRMADAHLVIARAGASTVTELSVIGRPSILTPLPSAMDDHQTGNAKVLSTAGGALLAPEGEDYVETLSKALQDTIIADGRLAEMARAAKGVVKTDATARLADLVDEHLLSTPQGKVAA
ncbi:MAG: UDP-N-acetylglucosamine--N-acetylmuramyl-(pentapeptide) pyrophosphoryl-undecaprenol N-acetylglucosamine transferase [Pseudomonadota bacterium]